jgi:acetolactate decarboxylase
MNFSQIAYKVGLLLMLGGTVMAQTSQEVQVIGAMKNVMWKGQLQGSILLDTIQNKQHLYGLGPKEYLKGELLIVDGTAYVSSVNADGSIRMEKTFNVRAPFFVYANTGKWKEYSLPETIQTMGQLEEYIDGLTKESRRPFAFRLKGTLARVDFHIQNLPEGVIVKSPKDAHQGQKKYTSENREGEVIGFFSTEHQTIFTHHDTFIHMHFISSDATEMGHVDDLVFDGKSTIQLYLPAE